MECYQADLLPFRKLHDFINLIAAIFMKIVDHGNYSDGIDVLLTKSPINPLMKKAII
jgi:hypothetical protein